MVRDYIAKFNITGEKSSFDVSAVATDIIVPAVQNSVTKHAVRSIAEVTLGWSEYTVKIKRGDHTLHTEVFGGHSVQQSILRGPYETPTRLQSVKRGSYEKSARGVLYEQIYTEEENVENYVGHLSTPEPVGDLSTAHANTDPSTEDLLGTMSVQVQVENMGHIPVGHLSTTNSPVGGLPAVGTNPVGLFPAAGPNVGGLSTASTNPGTFHPATNTDPTTEDLLGTMRAVQVQVENMGYLTNTV